MPWSRLKTTTSGDTTGALRRHSTIDPLVIQKIDDQNTSNNALRLGHDALDSVKTPSPLRNSFEPSTVEQATSSTERAQSPMPLEQPQKRQRFSMLKYRHASDPQVDLSLTSIDGAWLIGSLYIRYQRQPEIMHSRLYRLCQQVSSCIGKWPSNKMTDYANLRALTAPSIVTTAPQDNLDASRKKKPTFTLPRRHKPPELARTISSKPSNNSLSEMASISGRNPGGPTFANPSARESRITFEEPDRFKGLTAPPAYGDDSNSSLALPISRLSESSRSEGSLGDHGVYATTTTTHTVSTTTTFFRLPRRKKNKGPLFPLPVKVSTPDPSQNNSFTPRASIGAHTSESPRRLSPARTPPLTAVHRSSYSGHDNNGFPSPLPSPTHVRDEISRMDSSNSGPSGSSSPVRTDSAPFGRRGRSSTKGSIRQSGDNEPLPTPPLPLSGRTSSSTTGRASLGGLFNLSRLRQNSEPLHLRQGSGHPAIPGTPIAAGSKSQSFSLSREPVTVPERQEGDTPAKYLIRLEEAVSRGVVATILSQSNDDFFKNVLRSYMRGFKFFGDPLDMSTRKLLMEVELPKETQQIDRVLQAFANRYHECNPGVYASPGKSYSSL